ncbi:hypothetical protein VCRA2119O430_160050 [Vibrio crassostreae]|nr:hypothetical protein VCRA2119O430_160050 [Vibrio crassostreae]CAK1803272.1 hypothetical protein VCRA2114O422_180063 [Vibrio crassostreae]CAK2293175.1 hypothetical protein VCRA2116O425_160064 [Vibrio crassostreae]CAK2827214.1 hypothetical protein VCRA2133O452_220063 [Vibrio crassostreae]CAK3218257.1 hypothetical protein VCRA2126O446_170041 [Vibrio crassostreae]
MIKLALIVQKRQRSPIIALIKQIILDLNQSGGINQVSRFFEMKTSQNNSVSKNNSGFRKSISHS